MVVSSRRGFTFLEMMVVVAILVVFTILAAPAMRGPHEKNKLRAAARDIVSTMRYARAAAILNEAVISVELDLNNHRRRLDLQAIGQKSLKKKKKSWGKPKKDETLKDDLEYWVDLPDRVIIAKVYSWEEPDRKTNVARIRFYPDGSASDSAVVLQNSVGHKMTIVVNRATAVPEIVAGVPSELR